MNRPKPLFRKLHVRCDQSTRILSRLRKQGLTKAQAMAAFSEGITEQFASKPRVMGKRLVEASIP